MDSYTTCVDFCPTLSGMMVKITHLCKQAQEIQLKLWMFVHTLQGAQTLFYNYIAPTKFVKQYQKSSQRRRRWGYYHQRHHSGQTEVLGVVPIMFQGMSGGFTTATDKCQTHNYHPISQNSGDQYMLKINDIIFELLTNMRTLFARYRRRVTIFIDDQQIMTHD
jgi:hypothetical protein